MQNPIAEIHQNSTSDLLEFIRTNQPLVVLTGAGCSTESGIPDYRDKNGQWKYRQPVQFMDFVGDSYTRKRYWSRSMLGWPVITQARPNAAHTSLATLELSGYLDYLVTQNVDGLHQKAGSQSVAELHGGLEWVICLDCRKRIPRQRLQETLLRYNPEFEGITDVAAPDGDADLEDKDLAAFRVPECTYCGGMLKPDVVFFGESVPKARIGRVIEQLDRARGLLVIGSSLMVFSGYRFCKYATEQGKSVAVLNQGRTRADSLINLKIDLPCHLVLPEITGRLLLKHEIQPKITQNVF